MHYKAAGEFIRMIMLDTCVKVILKAQNALHFFQTKSIPVELREVEDDGVIQFIFLHPLQFFIEEEARVCDGALPVFLEHIFSLLIYPEDFFVLHKGRDLLRIG
jgi:hypothetical protein